jgi:hypothetical protein
LLACLLACLYVFLWMHVCTCSCACVFVCTHLRCVRMLCMLSVMHECNACMMCM